MTERELRHQALLEQRRDRFAAAALTGLLSHPDAEEEILATGAASLCHAAWDWADTMIKAEPDGPTIAAERRTNEGH